MVRSIWQAKAEAEADMDHEMTRSGDGSDEIVG